MNNTLTENFVKCYKNKCKEKYDKVMNDKNLISGKRRFLKEKDIIKKEKIIRKVYSNPIQRDLDLCAYKSCKIVKKLQKHRLKIMKDKMKLYDIKLTPELQLKFKRYEELIMKTSMNDDEYLEYVILFQTIHSFLSDKIILIKKPFYKSVKDFLKCSKKCNNLHTEVLNDKDLMKKHISVFNIKDDKKRNKMIRDVYSNEKQVKLDKCITKKCNKSSLKLLQESMKLFEKKIKYFNIKIPDNIKLPDIKKITEADIPEIIIKINQIGRYIGKDIYIGNL